MVHHRVTLAIQGVRLEKFSTGQNPKTLTQITQITQIRQIAQIFQKKNSEIRKISEIRVEKEFAGKLVR